MQEMFYLPVPSLAIVVEDCTVYTSGCYGAGFFGPEAVTGETASGCPFPSCPHGLDCQNHHQRQFQTAFGYWREKAYLILALYGSP